MRRKIVFLTGTRADFGKMKSLMKICTDSGHFDVRIFATGMHMNRKYGRTVHEIRKAGFRKIFMYYNHGDNDTMDIVLSRTVEGFSAYVKDEKPDMVIIHGDRVETLSGAIVGGLNNILTAHVEGGEVSGTIDESIRHCVSKLAHLHFVSNRRALNRLLQMGEQRKSVHVIGSPNMDIMQSRQLPSLEFVKKHYNILTFNKYSILIFHPVTTQWKSMRFQAKQVVDAVLESNQNFIVIAPNNDMGTNLILSEYSRFKNKRCVKVFPSMRFEYYLVLLRHAQFIIGNSSSGIMEAPFYQVPTVNIGSRQQGRTMNRQIIHCEPRKKAIISAMDKAMKTKVKKDIRFGNGHSDKKFLNILKTGSIWDTGVQKTFAER